jgi:ferritin
MKLFDFMLARNGKIELKAMGEPDTKYSSVAEVFERAYKQEQEVSQQIDVLYELAFREKAFAATVELEWFLMEQVEEEKTARDIVRKLHLIRDDPASLLDLDRELGARAAGMGAQESPTRP